MAAERIVAAALAVVDEEGADALSMRTLAQRLESGTATLYRHFTNRAELVARVIDHVLGELAIGDDELAGQDWQRSSRKVATAMFATFSEHPNVARLLLEQMPMGPNAMARREAGIAVFLDNGFTPDLAALCYATLSRFVLGFAVQLTVDKSTQTARESAAFGEVDPERFPAIAATAEALPVALDVEFAFGLDLLLDGLDQLRVRSDAPRSTRTAAR